MSNIQPRSELLFNAITATATSRPAGIDNAGRLSLMITASGVSTASATFYVDVSNDTSKGWAVYQRLTSNTTNTNAQTDARVNNLLLSANGTQILFFPPGDTFNFLRMRADVNKAEGTYNAVLYVN